MRHLAQIFQGLMMSTPDKYNSDPSKLIRLWLHESERTCEWSGGGAGAGHISGTSRCSRRAPSIGASSPDQPSNTRKRAQPQCRC